MAAAVIFPPDYHHPGIRDSKKLSPAQRERIFPVIDREASACAVALATPEEIDGINILRASLLAMRRAVEALPSPPTSFSSTGTSGSRRAASPRRR